jgi:hypothetical protein
MLSLLSLSLTVLYPASISLLPELAACSCLASSLLAGVTNLQHFRDDTEMKRVAAVGSTRGSRRKANCALEI